MNKLPDFTVQINQQLMQGNLPAALAIAHQAVQQQPKNSVAYYEMSRLLTQARRLPEALAFAHKSLELAPNDRFYASNMAKLLALSGKHNEALQAAGMVQEMQPGKPETWDNLNQVYTIIGELQAAADAAKQAYELKPNFAHFVFNYAAALRNIGEMTVAEELYNKVLELNPKDYEACKNRSDLRRQTPEDNHIADLEQRLANCTEPRGKMLLQSALAKELEDIGEHARSFQALTVANKLRRGLMQYSLERDLQAMRDLKQYYDQEFFAKLTPVNTSQREPIFILGLPRTGSTLLDRMLNMHSQIFSAGELSHLTLELAGMMHKQFGKLKDKTEFVRKSTQLDFAQLGENYIQRTRPRTGHTAHFIDKMPTNFLNIGLIKAALPHAKVLHVQRDPIDTCYAIYKNLFKEGYPFSYDQEELAQYYIGYRELMAHWQAMLPGFILDVEYEQLVAEPEQTLRKVLDFCELDWEPACLDFADSAAPTNTASAAQVRQPLYKSSIGKSQLYQEQLQPIITRLEEHGYLPGTLTA